MITKFTLTYSLVLFCSLFVVAGQSSADGVCTPVVYAFRHAEDFNPTQEEIDKGADPTELTPAGEAHAELYPEMIFDFEHTHGYCDVGWVYSMYDRKPNTDPGTTNPYSTAAPLAGVACSNFWEAILDAGFGIPGSPLPDPDSCGSRPNLPPEEWITGGSFPRMALRSGGKLYEFLGTIPAEQGGPSGPPRGGKSATFDDLRVELLQDIFWILETSSGETQPPRFSVAIFWTSQGLNVLGQGIVQGFTGIPETPKPPRNAVYVFELEEPTAVLVPPTNVGQYLQCFNVNKDKKLVNDGNYYCSLSGTSMFDKNNPFILTKEDLKAIPLRGRICDTTELETEKTGCVIIP